MQCFHNTLCSLCSVLSAAWLIYLPDDTAGNIVLVDNPRDRYLSLGLGLNFPVLYGNVSEWSSPVLSPCPAAESRFERVWSQGPTCFWEPGPPEVMGGHRWSWVQAEPEMSPVGVLSSQEQGKRLFCSTNRGPVVVGYSSWGACLPVHPVLFSLIPPKASAMRQEEWCVRGHRTSVGPPLPETSAAAVIRGENPHTQQWKNFFCCPFKVWFSSQNS